MTLGGLLSAINDIKKGNKMGSIETGWGVGTSSSYKSELLLHKKFTWIPRRCYNTGQWIWGKMYKDSWGHTYHPEEAMNGVLEGKYVVTDA